MLFFEYHDKTIYDTTTESKKNRFKELRFGCLENKHNLPLAMQAKLDSLLF